MSVVSVIALRGAAGTRSGADQAGRPALTLDAGVSFSDWAREQWPAPRWSVDLEPWQLSPALRDLAQSATCPTPRVAQGAASRLRVD